MTISFIMVTFTSINMYIILKIILDRRVEDDVMKILILIVKRKIGRPKKQKISSVGESKSSSKCTLNCKSHNKLANLT